MTRGEIRAVRAAWHGEAADLHLRLCRDEALQVLANHLVRDAGELHVQRIVVRLVVGKLHVGDGQHRVYRGWRRVERRVETRVEPRRLERLEKFRRPFPEEKRFAAGERDATA